MSITIIEASSPDVISAVPERTCNIWAVQRLHLGGDGFPLLNCSIEVNKLASYENGATWSPSDPVVIHIPDLFAAAVSNPKLEQLVNLVNEIVDDELTTRGLK